MASWLVLIIVQLEDHKKILAGDLSVASNQRPRSEAQSGRNEETDLRIWTTEQ